MRPLISVIIPVYKVEQYLHRCVDSILNQTYTDLEIILIDDGSPDKCPVICDEYAALDSRVVVIHKNNGGVSSARNAGLNIMKGEYVCFVDSDDYLPNDSIMNLYNGICENVSYVVGMCGYNGNQAVKNNIKKAYKFTISENPEALLSYIVERGSYSPYAKLYRGEIIRRNMLRFREDMRISEDTVFLRTYLKYCITVSFVPYVVYKYNVDNVNSLSKKPYEEYSRLYTEKMKCIEALVNKLSVSKARKTEFLSERAIHGIKISIDHYFNHWNDKSQLLLFIKELSELLLPWVDDESESSIIKKNDWWMRYYKLFRSSEYNKLYRKFIFNKRKYKLCNIIKKKIRSIIYK